MLRLFHAPMACSLASRFALVEAGVPFDLVVVRTWKGEQRSADYLAINPRGKVPALQTDEGVITETAAILPFIADLAPEKRLFPLQGAVKRAQAQAWLSYLSSTVHVAIAAVLFPPPGRDAAADAAALEKLASAFAALDQHLQNRGCVLDDFSVCDLYLMVLGLWRGAPALSGRLPSFPHIDSLQQTLFARPGLAALVGEDMKLRAEA